MMMGMRFNLRAALDLIVLLLLIFVLGLAMLFLAEGLL